MKEHKLTLLGGRPAALRVPAAVLQEALAALIDGARSATRFAVEGESVRKGKRPDWLEAACAIDVTVLSPGSTVIRVEAPTLQEADAVRFAGELFDDPNRAATEATAIELFGEVLASVLDGEADAVMADRALLDSCVRFARVGSGSVDGIRLEGLRGRDAPLVVTPADVPAIERLRDETPAPQATRVAGQLDTISASRADVTLTLRDGTKLPALMEGREPERLKELWGKQVVVSGLAQYRPSGRLLRVLVESIALAGPADSMFEVMPRARATLPVAVTEAQDEASGVSAFFGTWPGDESDDELLEALRRLR